MRGGYVYFFVKEDRSFGIHNPQFTVAMLNAAINELKGVTGIETIDNTLPTDFELSQNYPNPFNPTTLINFALPQQADVKITVYNALGREVELLADKKMDAENYKVDWNASNYAAGIYFYSIRANSYTATKKMVLLK